MNANWYNGKMKEITTALEDEHDLDFKVEIINKLRQAIHEVSPFKDEPTDCVRWVKVENIMANAYNPNVVAPPEMELLHVSIKHDGYTMPCVTWMDTKTGTIEIVDGFHRSRVCKEYTDINNRVHGYLPISIIKEDCTGINDRIAATVRHNRARGAHRVDGMSNIVLELKKRNWSDKRIGKELGMDQDEVLRLAQITGLAAAFKDREFSQAWEAI